MNNIGELINSVYNNFVLRDIVGKIVPGALVLFGMASLRYAPERLFQFIRGATALETGFWIAAAWVVAFGVQAIGERTGLIRLWPKGECDSIPKSRTEIICFGRRATADEKRIAERYVIIKEACGLGYFATAIALCLLVIGHEARRSNDVFEFANGLFQFALTNKLLFISAVVVLVGLYWTHLKHLERQYATYDAVKEVNTILQSTRSDVDLSQSFADLPEIYDHYRVDYPGELVDQLVSKSRLKQGDMVLEIGAGSGKLTHHLLREGFNVTCVEPASSFVEFLKKRFENTQGLKIIQTRFEELETDTAKHRLIIAAQAFHWVDWNKGLRKTAEMLDSDGHLALIFYNTKIVNRALRKELDQIYSHYPRVEARLPGSGPSSRLNAAAKIKEINLFSEPLVIDFSKTYKHSTNDYKMLTLTESQHKKLAYEDRERLIGAACKAIEKHGGHIETEYTFTCYLARVIPPRGAS